MKIKQIALIIFICQIFVGILYADEPRSIQFADAPAYTPNFLGAMAEIANAWAYDHLSMQQHYNNNVKFLGFISGSFFDIAGASIYFDLADYYSSLHNIEISKEGCDHSNPGKSDWITVWIDFEIGASVGSSPVDVGIIPINISEYADPPRSFDVIAL